MKKALIIVISIMMICTAFISCSKADNTQDTTSDAATDSTAITGSIAENEIKADQNAEDNEATPQNDTSTTKAAESPTKKAVKDDEAQNTIETMYGDYDIELEKTVDNVQYYTILENGKKYATLKVDLLTGDCYETKADTNELTTFNLLS